MNLIATIQDHPDDAVAVISRGHATTYGELRSQAASLAGGLRSLGLEPGDRVGIVAGTNWYFAVSYLGILHAGLVAVPLNPTDPPPAIRRELGAVGARGLIVGPTGRAVLLDGSVESLPDLAHVVVTEGSELDGRVLLDDLLGAEPIEPADLGDDELAALIFTSGTAGSPKAAMLTHGNLRSNLEQLEAQQGRSLDPSDVVLGVLPLFHIFGLNVALMGALKSGATILLIERFDPVSAIEAIARHHVTVVSGAPTMWAAWAQLPDLPPDCFAPVRLAASGAAKLDPTIATTLRERFGLVVGEGYGLTEASPVVTSSAGQEAKLGSIGAPLPGVEVRLVDPDGGDVLVGDPGEIWVRGPNVFAGYWDDPEATANAITDDGWLRTGDIAVVDDSGSLFIVDRAKDLIIVSGFNVYPAEVEEVLLDHPGIDTAAVVGVAHPYTGEAVKAYVVVEPGHSFEEDELIDYCSGHLARYKCPTKVMFVDELPTGLTGKVLRRALQ